jgi:hypothetical protein
VGDWALVRRSRPRRYRRLLVVFAALAALGCGRVALDVQPPNDPPPSSDPPGPQPTPCDRDGDGYLARGCGGDDCDDANPAVHPGAPDLNAVRGSWIVSRAITSTGGTANGTAIAIDRAGGAHIAYAGGSSAGLLYARQTGGGWQVESIDPTLELIQSTGENRPDITFDARGSVHVAYACEAGVRHAVRARGNGQAWLLDTLDAAGRGPAAIASGPDGTIHVAYVTAAGLHHASNPGGTWQSELVDSIGAAPSLAVDTLGTLHVTYSSAAPNQDVLRYAVRSAGTWRVETASQTKTASSSLVIDSAGLPRIALGPRFTTDPGVRYLVRVGGRWSESALPATDAIYSVSLRLDAADEPHLLFSYISNMFHAVGAAGAWQTERIVILGHSDVRPSFDLDRGGVAHVASTSFFFDTHYNVEYSTNRQLAPDGVDQDCDGTDGVDGDRDGHASLATGGDDCDDDDPGSLVRCNQ